MRVLHVGDDFAALRPCGLTLYSDALMHAQANEGHDVSYFFSGRHYPWRRKPRLKRWTDREVRMYELVGSPIHSHWEAGTREPARDLQEPAGEAAFETTVRESGPEIVHIHELSGLPSSLIEHAKAHGAQVVMTLHDYKPVCASVRLLDADGQRCFRHEVGEDCARNCASAPGGRAHLVNWTLDYELSRAKRAVPLARSLDFGKVAPLVAVAKRGVRGSPRVPDEAGAKPGARPAEYQRRRDVNVERLCMCDRLVAPSARVAEIYADLGVDERRLTVQRLTLPRLEQLAPRSDPAVNSPLTFVTLGGCASVAKGSRVMTEAVLALERAGHGGDYRLIVLGHVEPAVVRELSQVPAVTLQGRYAPEELDGLLDIAHVGILPSIWEEVHGFVGIEMLAKGLPVIANALGGIPEYVTDGETGWINRSNSGSGIAELMAAAIKDPSGVERLSRTVRDRRHELVRPMDEHVAEVAALYAETLQAAAISSPAARRAGS